MISVWGFLPSSSDRQRRFNIDELLVTVSSCLQELLLRRAAEAANRLNFHQRIAGHDHVRRANPTRPITPLPNNQTAAGIGTGVTVRWNAQDVSPSLQAT